MFPHRHHHRQRRMGPLGTFVRGKLRRRIFAWFLGGILTTGFVVFLVAHRNPNWINLHNKVFDQTCTSCHDTKDAGGTSNTSFCSNSACHGTVFTFAGFDATALREILQSQLPTPVPTVVPAPVVGTPTYDANIGPLLTTKCGMCHGTNATAGLNVTTYTDLMKGGKDGVVITPGDSANSKIVSVQSEKHFANLSEEELQLLIQWIDADAPEK